MAGPILTGALWGANNSLRNQATSYAEKIDELREYRRQDAEIINQLRLDYAVLNTHYDALEAKSEYLMSLLDKVHGTAKNPARENAYDDEVTVRIPAGPRKGERLEMHDHVYLEKFISVFKKHFSEYASNWKDFIQVGIFK